MCSRRDRKCTALGVIRRLETKAVSLCLCVMLLAAGGAAVQAQEARVFAAHALAFRAAALEGAAAVTQVLATIPTVGRAETL